MAGRASLDAPPVRRLSPGTSHDEITPLAHCAASTHESKASGRPVSAATWIIVKSPHGEHENTRCGEGSKTSDPVMRTVAISLRVLQRSTHRMADRDGAHGYDCGTATLGGIQGSL